MGSQSNLNNYYIQQGEALYKFSQISTSLLLLIDNIIDSKEVKIDVNVNVNVIMKQWQD